MIIVDTQIREGMVKVQDKNIKNKVNYIEGNRGNMYKIFKSEVKNLIINDDDKSIIKQTPNQIFIYSKKLNKTQIFILKGVC